MARPSSQQQAKCWLRSAQRLVKADRYEAALDALDRAIELTRTAELYDYRGVVLSLMDRREAAVESYGQAVGLASTPALQAQIYFHRGLLYGNEGAYDQALLDFARATSLNPAERSYLEARLTLERERDARTSEIPA